MKGNLETAWLRSTAGERQDFIELYADDIRELLPRYNDHDDPETEELLVQGDDGDDEALDAPELPAVLDTNDSDDDDGAFPAADDEDFHGATRGNRGHATGKRVTAAPRSAAEIERLTAEFIARGGQIAKVRPGISRLQPAKPRAPAWRRKIVSSKEA